MDSVEVGQALVFAAGLGTRLRPLTDTMPKALVEVGGVPMLERVVRKIQAAGIDRFVVNAHHFAPKIEEFIAARDGFGSQVTVSIERDEPLETGGGIKKAEPLLEGGPFLVHNADILSDVDLSWFLSCVRKEDLATLLVTDIPADRYLLFDEGMRLVGWTNVRTGEVKSPYPDFDASKYRRLSFCGIHVISDAVFPLMKGWPAKFPITDFYLSVCAAERIRGVEAKGISVMDIGSPGKLEQARRLYSGR